MLHLDKSVPPEIRNASIFRNAVKSARVFSCTYHHGSEGVSEDPFQGGQPMALALIAQPFCNGSILIFG